MKKIYGCRIVDSTNFRSIHDPRLRVGINFDRFVKKYFYKEAFERYMTYFAKCNIKLQTCGYYHQFIHEFQIQLDVDKIIDEIKKIETYRNHELFQLNDSLDENVDAYLATIDWEKDRLYVEDYNIVEKVDVYMAYKSELKQELESIEFPHALTQHEKLEKLKKELETIPTNPYEDVFIHASKHEIL